MKMYEERSRVHVCQLSDQFLPFHYLRHRIILLIVLHLSWENPDIFLQTQWEGHQQAHQWWKDSINTFFQVFLWEVWKAVIRGPAEYRKRSSKVLFLGIVPLGFLCDGGWCKNRGTFLSNSPLKMLKEWTDWKACSAIHSFIGEVESVQADLLWTVISDK